MSEEATKYTRRHMCMSIEGCLRNNKGKKITFMDLDNGEPASDKQARQYLAECQAKGWKVIPLGGECEGFDYFGSGCPGHPITKEEYELKNKSHE